MQYLCKISSHAQHFSILTRAIHHIPATANMARNHQVLVTRKIPQSGLTLLNSVGAKITQWDRDDPIPRDVMMEKARGMDALFVLLTDKVDKELLDHCGSNLKVIGTMSVGYDHIDVNECKRRGIKLGYTPDVLTHATAELTVTLLLATSRRVAEGVQAAKDGSWGTWKPNWLCGPSLQGSTVGIFGYGRIGQQVCKNLSGFEVGRFIYCNTSQVETTDAERVSFDDLLKESDFLIVCCALTEDTRGVFSTEVFKKMKKTAVLVNTSRGAVVDMNDLAVALETGELMGAGLDVTVPEPLPLDHKLFTLNNCIVLPHIGSATIEARSAMSELTAQNIIQALNGDAMPAEIK